MENKNPPQKKILAKLTLSIIFFSLIGSGGYYFYEFTNSSKIQNYFRNGEPFGILILNVQDTKSQDWETTFLAVAHVYPKTSRIGFISFYPSTRLNPTGISLNEKIRESGLSDIAEIKKELSTILNIPIEYHLVTDFEFISNLIDLAEGVKYFHWNPDGSESDLPQGEFVLDGSMVKKILIPDNTNEAANAIQMFSHYTLFLNFWNDKKTKWDIIKQPEIFVVAKTGLKTDLSMADMIFLGNIVFGTENWLTFFMEIPVKREVDQFYLAPDAAALYLKNLNKQLSNPKNPYLGEVPRVEVRNGTNTAHLAKKTGRSLSRKGVTVLEFSNADRNNYKKSILLDTSANPYYLMSMARNLGIQKYYAAVNKSLFTDVILILGDDHETFTAGKND
ncbi:MAG: LCP family protein [Leptospirales bacterium]